MSFTIDQLYALLPAVYRVRDAEQGYPLKALVAVMGEQIAVLEENLQQLYDDQFIETCADWVVPYIGALVGANGLNPPTSETGSYDPLPNVSINPRALVANTIGYRRRKGTAVVLEQLARDVVGWNAHAVEYFQLLVGAQNVNHIRPAAVMSPDLRKWEPLQYVGTPFDTVPRMIDVRRIASERGKYNIPNIGIFIWRVQSNPISNAPAFAVDANRFKFCALGIDAPLYTAPRTELEFSQLAQPIDAPLPIRPLILNAHMADYFGSGLSINVTVFDPVAKGYNPIAPSQISVCSLADTGSTWGVAPQPDVYSIDPILGRLLLASNTPSSDVRVSYHYGFPADIGGGEYGRVTTFKSLVPLAQTPLPFSTVQAGLNSITGSGTLEITDSGLYNETPSLAVGAGKEIEIRAADLTRPVIALGGMMKLSGGENADLTLNGLVITGGVIKVSGAISKLTILHCSILGQLSSSKPALIIDAPNVSVQIQWSIVAGIRVANTATAEIHDSILDSGAAASIAYAAPGNTGAGAPLTIQDVTIIGTVHTQRLEEASNTIFFGKGAQPVLAEQVQQGCVRFCYVPLGSQTPRRYRCQPAAEDADADARVRPLFNSTQYGSPDYCQLSGACAIEIRTGSDDSSEMGVYHGLYQPQREANLRQQLGDYLRFGLEAGIFYAS